jgi:Ras-related protein Rab-1A
MEEKINVIVIGNYNVGKTSLIKHMCKSLIKDKTYVPTIGVDLMKFKINIDSKSVLVLFHDTAGQERFQTITKSFYKLADAIILMYSIDDKESFLKLDTWLNEIKLHSQTKNVYLVGGKVDVYTFENSKSLVLYEEATKYLDDNKDTIKSLFELSTVEGYDESVGALFNQLLKDSCNQTPSGDDDNKCDKNIDNVEKLAKEQENNDKKIYVEQYLRVANSFSSNKSQTNLSIKNKDKKSKTGKSVGCSYCCK